MTNEVEPFAVMAREMITWSGYIKEHTGWVPPCVDIGGGWTFGKSYRTGPNSQIDDSSAPSVGDYAEYISHAIEDEARKLGLPIPKLRIEPGRILSGPIGVAVGTVGAVKQNSIKKWVNLDLSTNHLSWAAILDWYYHAVAVEDTGREATEVVDLVGPLCNSDELGKQRKMPPLTRGDYVAFLDAGGYVESQAARYNAQCLPATILVCGDRYWADKDAIRRVLEILHPEVVIHGGAKGADSLAGEVANDLNIATEVYPAQWSLYGKGAGPIRNTLSNRLSVFL